MLDIFFSKILEEIFSEKYITIHTASADHTNFAISLDLRLAIFEADL